MLCAGDSKLRIDATEGSELHVAVALTDATRTQATLELITPDGAFVAGPRWLGATIETSGPVTIDGKQRVEVRADVELAATVTVTLTPPRGRVLHIAPDGDDVAAGTLDAPWQTWPVALAALMPGDTLIAHDGTWTDTTCTGQPQPCLAGSPAMRVDCAGAAVRSGTPAAPITVVAQHSRRAHIIGDGDFSAINVSGCDSWILDGLHARNADFAANITGPTLVVLDAPRFVARRMLLEHPNKCGNNHAVLVQGPGNVDVVIEDSEFYDFHRAAILMGGVASATVRRAYMHSRSSQQDPCQNGSDSFNDRGDAGVICFFFNDPTTCTTEASIAENVGLGYSDVESARNRVTRSLARDAYVGAIATSNTADRSEPVMIDNFVCLDCDMGIWNRGVQMDVKGATLVRGRARNDLNWGQGVISDYNGLGPPALLSAVNVLTHDHERRSFNSEAPEAWLIRYSNASTSPILFLPNEVFDDDTGSVQRSMSVEPTLVGDADGSCLVHVPPASNMATAGEGGASIGANVITDDDGYSIWNQRTGAFTCGAIVPGVNDIPGRSCFDVHERFRVGVAGCPIP